MEQSTADAVDPGPYKPGTQITITGQNLDSRGAVLIDDLRTESTWSPTRITASIPSDVQAGAKLAVVVEPEGSTTPLQVGSIQIKTLPVPQSVLRPPYESIVDGDYREAVRAASVLLNKDPNDGATCALKAIGLIKAGQIDAARGSASKALRLTEGQPQGRARALALVAQGLLNEADNDSNGATQSYMSAGQADPSSILVYLVYADWLQKNGQNETAKRMLLTAQKLNPTVAETAAISARLKHM